MHPGKWKALIGNFRWLFINFFTRTYVKRVRSADPPADRAQIAKDSGMDAAGSVERLIREAMGGEQGRDETDISDVKAKLGDTTANLKKGAEDLGSKAKKSVQIANDAIRDTVQAAKEQATNWKNEYNESEEQNGERNGEPETRNGETKEEGDQNDISENAGVERSTEELEVETSEPEEIESNNLDGDEKAYEVNPDEVLDSAEKKIEEEMQPNGGA